MDNNYIYIYPSLPKNKDENYNPYLEDLANSLDSYKKVFNKNKTTNITIIDLIKSIFEFNSIIFNWIENLPIRKYGVAQSLIFLYFVYPILRIRKVKVIWIMHNIQLHENEGKLSKRIRELMIKNSDFIITHSREALDYVTKFRKKEDVFYFQHPVKKVIGSQRFQLDKKYDILIWGTISKYKGILEFLKFVRDNALDIKYTIKIVGKCNDSTLLAEINNYVNGNTILENRAASFSEVKALVDDSHYVLFPYNSESVSSSGAFIDTLSMYGTCIGPSKGAFLDLANEDVSFTFKDYDDIFNIIDNNKSIEKKNIEKFLNNNSWDEFGKRFSEEMLSK